MKKNIFVNILGKVWSVLSNFLFIPLYIKYLGIESYSVISFTLVLNGILAVMDAGLTSTISREFSSSKNDNINRLEIFKTLESIYFVLTIISIFIIFFLSDSLSTKWLNLSNIDPLELSFYLKLISFELGFRLLSNFYIGGFIGLDKQVKANIYLILYGVFRNGFVIFIILYHPSLKLFFLWQGIITFLFVIFIRLDITKLVTGSFKPFFAKPKILRYVFIKVWKFAAGMMLISLVAGLNTQMDKLALSKLLPIEILGFYTLAFALANGLIVISTPISNALLPKMTSLFTSNDLSGAIKIFKDGHLLSSSIVFSFSAILIFFPEELLFIWTNDLILSKKTSIYLPLVTLGMTFLAIQLLPFNVAIANGYTKFNNYIGLVSLILTLPGYWLMVKYFNGLGAAITFSFIQILSALIFIFLINFKFLKLKISFILKKFYLLPFFLSFSVVFIFKYLYELNHLRLFLFIEISFISMGVLFLNLLVLNPYEFRKKINIYSFLKNN